MPSNESTSPAPLLRVHQPSEGFPLTDVLPKYAVAHPALKAGSFEQLECVVSLVQRWGRELDPPCDALCCDEIFQLDAFELWVKWLFDSPKQRGTRPGEPRSPATVKNKRAYLWTLWKFAHKRGLCDEAPPDWDELAPIATPDEDPVAWSPDQIGQIIAQCRLGPQIKWWGPAHWLSLLWTNWYTVERIDGLLSCQTADLQGNVLYVRACRTKDKKPGVHRLNDRLCELIRSLPLIAGKVPEAKSALIWPYPFGLGSLRGRYRAGILRTIGLPDDDKHLFHCIRRSGLTEMVNVAGERAAQELARHSGAGLLDRYVSKRLLRTKSAAELLPDPTKRPAEQLKLF